jgi:4-hydroxy-2-oxoheptanedioate aldolase
MTSASLAALLREKRFVLSGWATLPDALVAENIVRSGFACVTLDMQHGLHDPVTVMHCIGAVALAGGTTAVRIPLGDFAMACRALDMGASAVIAPMINSRADAEALVHAVKYPPLGERSWGGTRAMQIGGFASGAAYLAAANGGTLAFAMIETRAAVDALDDILAVPGIDGVFVGPSDLSIALSNGAQVNPMDAENQRTARGVLARAHAAGKFAGIFAITGEQARGYRGEGYDLVALGSDVSYLRIGVEEMLKEALGG